MVTNYTPDVITREIDLTTTVQRLAASNVGLVIAANWGPCNKVVQVPFERNLVDMFSTPTVGANNKSWMTAATFMRNYGNTGHIVRAIDDTPGSSENANLLVNTDGNLLSAWATDNGANGPIKINEDAANPSVTFVELKRITVGDTSGFAVGETVEGDTSGATGDVFAIDATNKYLYLSNASGTFQGAEDIDNASPFVAAVTTVTSDDGTGFDQIALFYAKYPGTAGNNIKIAMADSSSFSSADILGATTFAEEFATQPYRILELADASSFSVGDSVTSAGGGEGVVERIDGNFIYVNASTDTWVANEGIDVGTSFSAPGDTTISAIYNEFAIVVLYENVIKERHIVSTYVNSTDVNGNAHFIEDYLENNSSYIYCIADESGSVTINDFSGSFVATSLTGGSSTFSVSEVQTAYDVLFADEEFDIRLIGDFHDLSTADVKTLQGYIGAAANLSTERFVVNTLPTSLLGSSYNITNINTHTASLKGNTYVSFFDNWKKVYDKYNKKRYFIPTTGDVLGRIVNTIDNFSVWSAPFGNDKGLISEVENLYWNPTEAQRDILYKNGINSVFRKRGVGYVIWGQKTMGNPASSRSRINVRLNIMDLRINIANVLDNFISFESNPETWRMVRNTVDEGYLKPENGKGRFDNSNGLGYKFVCDGTNNTPDVVDAYGMQVDLICKPIKSVERIRFDVTITSTGTRIEEL